MTDASVPVRHVLATLAYRAGKVTRDAPERFGKQCMGEGSKTAVETLAHMCDVLAWGTSLAQGDQKWAPRPVGNWHETLARFHRELAALDGALADGDVKCKPEMLVQGPLADCLTHVGQIALLRRMAGSPVKAENYSVAAVEIGRVGPDQQAPDVEL